MKVFECLKENLDAIVCRSAEKQRSFPYDCKKWRERLQEHSEFKNVLDDIPCEISRKTIIDLGEKIRNPNGQRQLDWERLKVFFIAIMIWGYARRGYGAWRVDKMLSCEKLQTILEEGYRNIANGKDLAITYRQFKPGASAAIEQLGPSFFTKYFYFVGKVNKCKHMPLILDSKVDEALDCLQYWKRNNGRKRPAKDAQDAKDVNNGKNERARYARYVQDMNDWAEELSKILTKKTFRIHPDQIEMFLFEYSEKCRRCHSPSS